MEIYRDEWISAEEIRKNQVKQHLAPLTPSEMEEYVLIIDQEKMHVTPSNNFTIVHLRRLILSHQKILYLMKRIIIRTSSKLQTRSHAIRALLIYEV